MSAPRTARRRSPICTAEQAAVMDFQPLDPAKMGAPDRVEWMKTASDDFALMCLSVAVLGKTKLELVEVFREGPDNSMHLIDCLQDMERRYKSAHKALRAAVMRLIVAGSALAVQS